MALEALLGVVAAAASYTLGVGGSAPEEVVETPVADENLPEDGVLDLFDETFAEEAEATDTAESTSNGAFTLSGFQPLEDALVIEVQGDANVDIAGQSLTEAGLDIALTDGSSVHLSGVRDEIDPATVVFLAV